MVTGAGMVAAESWEGLGVWTCFTGESTTDSGGL